MTNSAMERHLLCQRRILAEFGEQAVIGADLDAILQAACKGAGEGLGTHLAKFIQLDSEKRQMWVRSGGLDVWGSWARNPRPGVRHA